MSSPAIDPERRNGKLIVAVAIVALLFAIIEILIIRSYRESSRTTNDFARAVESTTYLANVQREFFLLQKEVIQSPPQQWNRGKARSRRIFLDRQLDILSRVGESSSFEKRVSAIRSRFEELASIMRNPDGMVSPEKDAPAIVMEHLEGLELELKGAFDAEETILFEVIGKTLKGREASQRFLVVLAGTVLVLGLLVGIAWSRFVRSKLSDAYRVLLSEMEERRSLQNELAHQAFHDSLTGLANRDLFTNDLEKALGRTARSDASVALLYVDLDNFKSVNDKLGHQGGDELLRAVSGTLLECIRPSDTVARLGGDEFAVIVDDVADVSEALPVAERLLASLDALPGARSRSIPVHASIGIALSDDPAMTADDLLRNADVAMYEAKLAGKNAYRVFDPEMRKGALDAASLELELRTAVEEDQLVLHYQPIVSLGSGKTLGFEALVRWNHPTRGQLPPAEFIPLAEERGLIASVDKWVLSHACAQMARWKEAHPEFGAHYVSVNISAAHFEDADLVSDVSAALEVTGLRPGALRLEVTESTLMRDAEVAAATLRHLRGLGVSVSLDDFGTGYSSLSYLRSFSLDTLKIDRSFIADVAAGPEESALTKAIIRIAQTLKLEVVAEGIESHEQVKALKGLRCGVGQGYLFSRPQPASVIEAAMSQPVTGGAGGERQWIPAPA